MNTSNESEQAQPFDLVEPELDVNVRTPVRSFVTEFQKKDLKAECFQRFSSMSSLISSSLFFTSVQSYRTILSVSGVD